MSRLSGLLPGLLLALMVLLSVSVPAADGQEQAGSTGESLRVLESFAEDQAKKSDIVQIEDQRKREIMFYMGVPLILMLIITVGLGVAMVVYRKKVFVAHMIFAGLSLTLALAHAVVGTVWFYPF